MAGQNTAVYGLYPDQVTVSEALEALQEAGFRNTDISVLFPENSGTKDFGHEKHSKAPEGAVAGAGTGAIVGGALGWLAGMGMLGLSAIPALNPVLAAGPVAVALSGIGLLGTVGGLAGAAVGSASPEYEAKRYRGRVRRAGVLLSVHCDDAAWVKRARQVLERTGARGISAATEAWADYGASEKPLPRTPVSRGSLAS
jgi:hypothetical protein